MAQKRYRLTTEGKLFAQSGTYRFRVGFEVMEGSTTRYCLQKQCPIVAMGEDDTIGTVNNFSQLCIQNMGCPTNTRINGATKVPPGSMVFEDVTGSTTPGDVDVDLDLIFP